MCSGSWLRVAQLRSLGRRVTSAPPARRNPGLGHCRRRPPGRTKQRVCTWLIVLRLCFGVRMFSQAWPAGFYFAPTFVFVQRALSRTMHKDWRWKGNSLSGRATFDAKTRSRFGDARPPRGFAFFNPAGYSSSIVATDTKFIADQFKSTAIGMQFDPIFFCFSSCWEFLLFFGRFFEILRTKIRSWLLIPSFPVTLLALSGQLIETKWFLFVDPTIFLEEELFSLSRQTFLLFFLGLIKYSCL